MDDVTGSERVVDARDVLCPGPFWELIKNYYSVGENDTITLLATESYDSDTKKFAPYWIKKTGNELIGVYEREGYYEISMKKTKPARHH